MTENANTKSQPSEVWEIFYEPEAESDPYTVALRPVEGRRGTYIPYIGLTKSGGYFNGEFANTAQYLEWRNENLCNIISWDSLPDPVKKAVRFGS